MTNVPKYKETTSDRYGNTASRWTASADRSSGIFLLQEIIEGIGYPGQKNSAGGRRSMTQRLIALLHLVLILREKAYALSAGSTTVLAVAVSDLLRYAFVPSWKH